MICTHFETEMNQTLYEAVLLHNMGSKLQPSKAVTYDKRPKIKRDPQQNSSLFALLEQSGCKRQTLIFCSLKAVHDKNSSA